MTIDATWGDVKADLEVVTLSSCPSPQTIDSADDALSVYFVVNMEAADVRISLSTCGYDGDASITWWDSSWDSKNAMITFARTPLVNKECLVEDVDEAILTEVRAQVCCINRHLGRPAVLMREMAAGEAVVMVSREVAVGGPMTVTIDCDGSVDCTDETSRQVNGARGLITTADGSLTSPSGNGTIAVVRYYTYFTTAYYSPYFALLCLISPYVWLILDPICRRQVSQARPFPTPS